MLVTMSRERFTDCLSFLADKLAEARSEPLCYVMQAELLTEVKRISPLCLPGCSWQVWQPNQLTMLPSTRCTKLSSCCRRRVSAWDAARKRIVDLIGLSMLSDRVSCEDYCWAMIRSCSLFFAMSSS